MALDPAGLWAAWIQAAPGLIGPVYPWLSALHIAALGLLLGSIAALDLRLLSKADVPGLADWARWLSRLAALGLGTAIASGFLLFSVQAGEYLGNSAFRWKLAALAIGIANALLARRLTGWRAVLAGGRPDSLLRISAGLSLLCWLAVLVLGRYIAFV